MDASNQFSQVLLACLARFHTRRDFKSEKAGDLAARVVCYERGRASNSAFSDVKFLRVRGPKENTNGIGTKST